VPTRRAPATPRLGHGRISQTHPGSPITFQPPPRLTSASVTCNPITSPTANVASSRDSISSSCSSVVLTPRLSPINAATSPPDRRCMTLPMLTVAIGAPPSRRSSPGRSGCRVSRQMRLSSPIGGDPPPTDRECPAIARLSLAQSGPGSCTHPETVRESGALGSGAARRASSGSVEKRSATENSHACRRFGRLTRASAPLYGKDRRPGPAPVTSTTNRPDPRIHPQTTRSPTNAPAARFSSGWALGANSMP
jgi:hypothetical protein